MSTYLYLEGRKHKTLTDANVKTSDFFHTFGSLFLFMKKLQLDFSWNLIFNLSVESLKIFFLYFKAKPREF